MVRHPPQSHFRQCKSMLLSDGSYEVQGAEVGIIPVLHSVSNLETVWNGLGLP